MRLQFINAPEGERADSGYLWEPYIGKFPGVGILFGDLAPTEEVNRLAERIVLSRPAFVAAWGFGAEGFHDLVDRLSLDNFGEGPTTVWDGGGTAADFIWDMAYPYQGLLNVADQDRGLLIIYFSRAGVVPNDVREMLGMP